MRSRRHEWDGVVPRKNSKQARMGLWSLFVSATQSTLSRCMSSEKEAFLLRTDSN